MLQEPLHPDPSELPIGERKGWSIEFSQNGRAFYAYLYPGHRRAGELPPVLDALRVAEDPG
ncbi:MAG TPA: hypothetical protein VIK66_07290 [Gaiellaceae bacterium]|jgi:hypothetical protein